MAEEKLKKSHLAIVLGIGLGVVLLIVLSLMCVRFAYHPWENGGGFLFFFYSRRTHFSLRYYIVQFTIIANRFTCSLTIVISRRDRQSFLKSKKDPGERLRKLDKVSPTCTLEKWWSHTKGNLGLSEAVDGQFVWCVFSISFAKEGID